MRDMLLSRLESEREALIGFLQGFLRAPSANPPGDTRPAATYLAEWLAAQGAPAETHAASDHLPNLVASFDGARPGPHLVLNGHIDVFPPVDDQGWSGRREGGRLYGRGAADMKAGTAAACIAYAWLRPLAPQLAGRLTLTCVSDEQTGGKWGTKWLLETMPERVTGDALLNGEPSGLNNVRFMEKGTVRVTIRVEAPGGHGGYPHLTRNPNKVVARIITELDERLHGRESPLPPEAARHLLTPEGIAVADAGLGQGASEWVKRLTFNPGVVRGGLKVNQIADVAEVECDFRVPVGIPRESVLEEVEAVCRAHDATFTLTEAHSYPPSLADPDHPFMALILREAEAATGGRVVPMSSLGGSDSRYWRYRGVPAFLYGPSPVTMGRADENVTEEEFLAVVRVHLLSAWEFLRAGA